MTVGDLIKHYRQIRGITLTKMAADTGIARTTLYRYERNSIKKIPPEKLVSVSVYLNIPYDVVINVLSDNNASEYRLDRFKSIYVENLGLEIKNGVIYDPEQKMSGKYKLDIDAAIAKEEEKFDDLQLLINKLSEEDRERAYNILRQVFTK